MKTVFLRRELRLMRWRLRFAFGAVLDDVGRTEAVEGVVVPEGLPRLGNHRLWEDWQRAKRHRAARQAAADWKSNSDYRAS